MISAEALHIGPLMLPWNLLFIFFALFILSFCSRAFGQKLKWSEQMTQQFRDSLWTSLLFGLIGARVVFVLLNWQAYLDTPIDMLKIQDKGFQLSSGILIGMAWFLWKNKALSIKIKSIFILVFSMIISVGILLKPHPKQDIYYPALSFIQLNQPQVQTPINQFMGQPTVVNLWASWCPPCHREMPVLQQAQQKNPNINFVMLNQGEDQQTVQSYLHKNHFQFKHVLLDMQGEMPLQMNMFGLPSTLFFNAKGQLIERHMGELSPAMLQQYLNKISE